MAVRREASLARIELRDQERYWLPVARQSEYPKIVLRFRMNRFIQQETSVARPTRSKLILAGLEQNLLFPYAVRRLLIQVEWAVPVGTKDYPAPIGRPDRTRVAGRIKREPCARAASREIH